MKVRSHLKFRHIAPRSSTCVLACDQISGRVHTPGDVISYQGSEAVPIIKPDQVYVCARV